LGMREIEREGGGKRERPGAGQTTVQRLMRRKLLEEGQEEEEVRVPGWMRSRGARCRRERSM